MKLQANQCTYSDLDCLLDSLISTNFTLSHLLKIMLVCSSTLVYLVLSTYLFTNTVILMKTLLLSSSTSSSSSPLFSTNTCQNHHSSLPMLVVHERSGILESEDNESEVQPVMRYCEPSMYLPVSVVENNTIEIENDELDDLLYRPVNTHNSSNTIDWSLLGLFSRNHLKATSNFIEVF